jgi:rhodanese-related sulfurtransferase
MKNKSRVSASRRPYAWIILLLLVVAAAAVWVFLQQNAKASSFPAEINVSQAYELYQKGAYVLDVREQSEWDAVHIPGAALIPLGSLPDNLSPIPKDAEIVVVCRSGNRSQKGRDILLAAGFERVTSMAGGMNQWAAAGYPTASGP